LTEFHGVHTFDYPPSNRLALGEPHPPDKVSPWQKRREAVMADILDEAYGIVQCKDCPWYKSCVTPMKLTAEDIRRQLESSAAGIMGIPQQGDISGIQGLLGGMATAAQNSLLEGCPVFIQRLRSSQELAQHIKKLMQSWGQEEADDKPDDKPIELPPSE